jgi:hypothetical protein
VALNGIKCELSVGPTERDQFDARVTKLEAFKNEQGATSFLGEYKMNHPKLATWTSYTQIMAITVLTNQATNYVITLPRIKKLVDLSLVHSSVYKYGPEEEEDKAAAIWSGGITEEQHQGDEDDDSDEEKHQGDMEDEDTTNDEEDNDEVDQRNPAAQNMEDVAPPETVKDQ